MKRLGTLLTFGLLISCWFTEVIAAVQIQPAHTGSWYNPQEPGYGGFINIAEVNGQRVFVISWFDHTQSGQPFWVLGSQPIRPGDSRVKVDMIEFPTPTTKRKKGEFLIEFISCNSAVLAVREGRRGRVKNIRLARLTKIEGMECF